KDRWTIPSAVMTAVWSLAFAFSGQVLVCIDYPHFEPLIATLLCLLLTCIVTARRRLVWPVLAFILSVREDAGLHAGLALLPLLFLQWRGGTSISVSRKALLALIGASFGGTAVSVAIKRRSSPSAASCRPNTTGPRLSRT